MLLNVDTDGKEGDVWEAPSLRMFNFALGLASFCLDFGVGESASKGDCAERFVGEVPGVVCLEGPAEGGGDCSGVPGVSSPQSPLSKANLPSTPPSCLHSVDVEVRRDLPVKVLFNDMTVR